MATATTYRIRDHVQKSAACAEIIGLPEDGSVEVVIREHEFDRSALQNALFHVWCGEASKQLDGWTLLEVKNHWKFTIVTNIFMASEFKGKDEYKANLAALKDGYRLKMMDWQRLKSLVVMMTHTADANVTEFTRIIEEVREYARTEMGIQLIVKTTMYDEAMGVKR